MSKIKQGLFKIRKKSNDKSDSADGLRSENGSDSLNAHIGNGSKRGDLEQTNGFSLTAVDWVEEGKSKGVLHNGSHAGLQVCITKIYHNYQQLLAHDDHRQEELKKPYKVKLQEYEGKIKQYSDKISKIREQIDGSKENIQTFKQEISDINQNPEKVAGDKVGKAGFIIGSIILLFLTIYLFIFYSSASYSAFFKQFSLDSLGVADSIFDPQALKMALKAGATELILITTIPFVFLGLGYLIHRFQEEPKWYSKAFKIGLLIVVTFIFDAILAYEITHKIYEIKKGNSFVEMPDYTVSMAFESVNFWLIIFAGFVVYLIWGFVFDLVMQSYGKLDKVEIAKKECRKKIKSCEADIKEYNEEISKLEYLKSEQEIKGNKIREILNHSLIMDREELGSSIHKFLDGWLAFLNFSGRPEEVKVAAREIVNTYLDNLLSNNEDDVRTLSANDQIVPYEPN